MYQVHSRLSRLSSRRSVQAVIVLLLVLLLGLTAQYMVATTQKVAPSISVQAATTDLIINNQITDPEAPAASTPTETTPPAQPAPIPASTSAPVVASTPTPTYDQVAIPSIGFSSRYVSVGLTNNGNIDVNPKLVGWWNGSAVPGSPGAAFLDGHIAGIFATLPNIKIGDDITVSRASGEQFHYTVVYRETVPLQDVDMKKALTVYGGAREGINLMTCAGSYDATLGTNNERLIVYAVRS